jgi:hypothetical protein
MEAARRAGATAVQVGSIASDGSSVGVGEGCGVGVTVGSAVGVGVGAGD